MKSTLHILAPLTILLAAPAARALDPALLGVGFTSAAEAKTALDTSRRTKVADAWAYPITAQGSLIPASASNIKRLAYVRPVAGDWSVVAAKITCSLPDRATCDALSSSIAQAIPRVLTETVDGKTKTTFRAQDEHATLLIAPETNDTHAITLLLWHHPAAGKHLVASLLQTPKQNEPQKNARPPVAGRIKSFLGLPFGKVSTRTKMALKKTPIADVYSYKPAKPFLDFGAYFACLTDKDEVYHIIATMEVGEWDSRDEVLGTIRYVATYIEKKYNCAHLRDDRTDSFSNPAILYRIDGSTVTVSATLSDKNYDWTIHISASDDELFDKTQKAEDSKQLEAL